MKMRYPEGKLSSGFLNRWAPNVFYVPLLLNTHSQAWWIWYPFWSISLTGWKGKGCFFNAVRAFSALQMITFLVYPVLRLRKEIMFRYKDRDWQSGRQMHFLVTKARQIVGLFFYTNVQKPALGARKLREGISPISPNLKHQQEITPSPYNFPLLSCHNPLHLPSSKSAVPDARVQA